MVEIADSLNCLYTGTLEERNGKYVIEVPESEIENGSITPSNTYRVALLKQNQQNPSPGEDHQESCQPAEPAEAAESPEPPEPQSPPVSEGEQRTVTIDTLGEKGDGIAKVERGYVVIVPDTDPNETVDIQIESVQENVAFADVIGRREAPTAQM